MSRMILTFFVITILTFLLGRLSGRFWYRRSTGKSNTAGAKEALIQCRNCLTYFAKANALEVKREGITHSFCSRECAAAFQKKSQSGNYEG